MSNTLLRKSLTFVLSALLGTGAAIAIAGTAPSRSAAPALKPLPVTAVPQVAPSGVVRLDPVAVTISASRFNALRRQLCDTDVAANPPTKSRG